ncbi:MAG: hypothetical protein H6818_17235 [Phycisphaerales bacterium]|nr:hypothetical protein [Phycisphaerales bacterium]
MFRVNRRLLSVWMVCLFVTMIVAPVVRADEPAAKRKVHGEITQVDGVRVLRVSGDPSERGFAHGYLLAQDIIDLIDGYLQAKDISGGPRRYEGLAQGLDHVMAVPGPYLVEIEGMLAGIDARLDGQTTVPQLGRKLARRDLVAINCVPDFVGFGCSSFAAWGNRTKDGTTIAGRNLDWHTIDCLRDSQIVVANIPAKDAKAAAWLSVTWPGMIVCLTGMNENGVTLAMHDAMVAKARDGVELTPRGFALRLAIEAARADHMEEDVLGVLRTHRVLVGNIVPVAGPTSGDGAPSMVFEYDGMTKNSKGVTVRHFPGNGGNGAAADDYLIATNHFRERGAIEACNRYMMLSDTFEATKDDPAVTVSRAWKLLKKVSMSGSGLVTYQSVVFEPNAMRMHVSFSTRSDSAPNGKRVTLDVAKLLERSVSIAAVGE